MVHIKLCQVAQHLRFDIFYQRLVVPEFVKPGFELSPVAVAVHHHVEFDIGLVGQPQAALGEVGTAQQRVFAVAVINVVELAVQQVGFADRADVNLGSNPLRAAPGNVALLQAVGQRQVLIFKFERLFIGFFGVERPDKSRFAEQKLE